MSKNQDERTQKLMRKIKEFSRQIFFHLFTVNRTARLVTTSSCNEMKNRILLVFFNGFL